jgi:IS4 transposase
MLEMVFDKFAKKAPVAVMARAILERCVGPDSLDALFDQVAERQYTRELLFSSVFHLMSLVVCRIQPSIHAAYQEHRDDIETSVTAVYDKLNGIDTATSRALVRDTARQMSEAVIAMNGTRTNWLDGYRIKILDGNCIEASEHRLKALRDVGGGALPGKSLVVYDPQLEMAIDVFPCEDGHAQERSLLDAVLSTVVAKDVWIADRNFCTRGFLNSIAEAGAYFIIREHEGLRWDPADGSPMEFVGTTDTGDVREQAIEMSDGGDGKRYLRRIEVQLKKRTRNDDSSIYILTNLPSEDASAATIAELYRKRWTIETAFQELEAHLHSEINSLGYPKAALFGFCVSLVAYNALAVVKGALRSVHGEEKIANEVSGFYLAGHLGRTYEGLMIAVDEEEWKIFRTMSDQSFAATLLELARRVNLAKFKKHKRGPKKPRKRRVYDARHPHLSTARLIT